KAARQYDCSKNRDCPDSANDLYKSAATGCHPGSGSGTSTAPTISTVSVCAFSAFVRCPIRSAARLPTGPREPISALSQSIIQTPSCHQQRRGYLHTMFHNQRFPARKLGNGQKGYGDRSRANRGRGLPARGHTTRVRLRGAAPPVLDGPSPRCVPSGGGCVTRFAGCEQDFVAVVGGAGGVLNH